jgi:mono/diheme cytochrome c family protein
MAVAALVGAPLEPRASPADTEYVARPEWYFLWLFQFGKYVEAAPWLRSLALPAAGLGFLVALPFLRHDRPRTRGLVVGGWCLAWVGLTALALHEDRALPPRPSYEQALRARAEKQYVDECESCHAASGRGDGSQARAFALKPPDFTSPDYWREARPEKMREVVRDGSGQDMPAFGKKLSDEEMDALVDLVRARWRPAGLP